MTEDWECLGGVAQLGERLLCKQEAIGSIPFASTNRQSSVLRPLSSDAGERLLCKQEVTGSVPVGSTRTLKVIARNQN